MEAAEVFVSALIIMLVLVGPVILGQDGSGAASRYKREADKFEEEFIFYHKDEKSKDLETMV